MYIFDVLNQHRSIRKYKADDVSDACLDKILEAAVQGTSSSGNMQTYSVIVTKNPELKQALYPLHFHQEMVLEAPVMMTFCSDFHRMRLWLESREAEDNFDNMMSFMIGAIDAILLSQSVALAAEAEGLGICYMGTTLANCQAIGEVLQLPANVVPVVGFSLGYPAETPALRDRLPLTGLVHREVYGEYREQDIDQIYADRERAGWERYMANSELREKVSEHQVKNLAQIYTTVKYTKASHQEYSHNVLNYLKTQNFFNN